MQTKNTDGEKVVISEEIQHVKPEPFGLDREDNYQQIPNLVFRDIKLKRLTPICASVYAAYVSCLGNNDAAWPSNKTVAAMVGVCPDTIMDSNKMLIECGHMERLTKSKRGTKNTRLLTVVEDGKVVKLPKSAKPIAPPRQSLDQMIEDAAPKGAEIPAAKAECDFKICPIAPNEDVEEAREIAWNLASERADLYAEEIGLEKKVVSEGTNNSVSEAEDSPF